MKYIKKFNESIESKESTPEINDSVDKCPITYPKL